MLRTLAMAAALSLAGMALAEEPAKGVADAGAGPGPGAVEKREGKPSGKPSAKASQRRKADGGTPPKTAPSDTSKQEQKPCEETKPCAIE